MVLGWFWDMQFRIFNRYMKRSGVYLGFTVYCFFALLGTVTTVTWVGYLTITKRH